jgi:hypothetical protein
MTERAFAPISQRFVEAIRRPDSNNPDFALYSGDFVAIWDV